MKTNIKLITALLFIMCVNSVFAADNPPIKIGACEWLPYTSAQLDRNGFMSEAAVEVLKKAGYESTIEFYPWKRAFVYAKEGIIQGLLGASYTEERTKWFIYPEPLTMDEMVLVTQKGKNVKFTSYKDLAPATIGIIIGSSWIDEFKTIEGLKLELVPFMEMNFKKVALDRLDYAVESRLNIEFLLNTSLIDIKDKVEIVLPPFNVSPGYLVFSKKMENYKEITLGFNKALKQMIKDGSIKKIYEKHGLTYSVAEGALLLRSRIQ
jgi:polar amino acid transport system substrate-binding protein